jgi:hypothetical protein
MIIDSIKYTVPRTRLHGIRILDPSTFISLMTKS